MCSDVNTTEVLHVAGNVEKLAELMFVVVDSEPRPGIIDRAEDAVFRKGVKGE